MSALNDSSHCCPKWMLWWAAPAGGSAAHAGDPQQARRRVAAAAGGTRCVDAAEQRAVGDGQVGVADDGVGGEPLAAGELDAGDRAVGAAQDRA